MNERERFIQTITFDTPDKVPFSPGSPRESTLRAWRAQGLSPSVPWERHLLNVLEIAAPEAQPPIDIGVDFRMIPQFAEEVLSHESSHYIVRDGKGNICEIADDFDVTYLRLAKDFVTRRWLRCPVENRADWEAMKKRYVLDAPGRCPDDFDQRCRAARQRASILRIAVNGPFWQLREWCGFEGLCVMMIDVPELVGEMARFWTDFVSRALARILERVVPDVLAISEDMAYKAKAMISPAMTRAFCMPSYVAWTALVRDAGCPIVDMDSDGYVGELIPLWAESGINCCNPMEVAALNDIREYRTRFGSAMAFTGGVDKRAMAKGGAVIRDELERLRPVLTTGGFIPSCDHGVPSDVSWPRFV